MNHDAIDRALSDEPEITPSSSFAWRVMREVRSETIDQQALPFPWKPLAAGLVLAVGLGIAGALTAQAPAPIEPGERLAYLAPGLAWLATALAGSLGLAWWSFRFAGRSQPVPRPPNRSSS